MAATDGLVPLKPGDAVACQPLSDEAGWNQVAADWQMLLTLGQGVAIKGDGGAPVATAVALPLDDRVGWISMVLVTAAQRGRGLARTVTAAAIARLEETGRIPVLDATPAGQPVYTRLGFDGATALRRMTGQGGGAAPSDDMRPATPEDLDWIAALDARALGVARRAVLQDLLTRPGAIAMALRDRSGFALTRAGRIATQIGPVVAPDAAAAQSLTAAALAAATGPVFIDALTGGGLDGWLETRGFTEQRPFLRMARGTLDLTGARNGYVAAAGPELG